MKPSLADVLKAVIDACGVIAAQALLELLHAGLEETMPGVTSKDVAERNEDVWLQWAKEIGILR